MRIFRILNKNKNSEKGFTLIEIMVASTLFVTVMLIISGSIVSVFSANQKSKTLRSVMDNLNLTMESMTRTIRFGRNYNCGSVLPLTTPNNCPSGSNTFSITKIDGSTVTYSLSSGRIVRREAGVDYFLTSPDVSITSLLFKVEGAGPYISGVGVTCASDITGNYCKQPKVIISVVGNVGSKSASSFSLQTTISQRSFDFQ